MAKVTYTAFPDHVKFEWTVTKRPGLYTAETEDGSMEIKRIDLPQLKTVGQAKEQWGARYFGDPEEIEVHVPEYDLTVVFLVWSWQEHSMGPNEEDIHGPYLKNPAPVDD